MKINKLLVIPLLIIISCIIKKCDLMELTQSTPKINFHRKWYLSEYSNVGSIVENVTVDYLGNERIEFSFGEMDLLTDNDKKISIPFRINSITGIVYLNESLTNRTGENFFIYIIVTVGDIIVKKEVFVNITNENLPFISEEQPKITNTNLQENLLNSSLENKDKFEMLNNGDHNDANLHSNKKDFKNSIGILALLVSIIILLIIICCVSQRCKKKNSKERREQIENDIFCLDCLYCCFDNSSPNCLSSCVKSDCTSGDNQNVNNENRCCSTGDNDNDNDNCCSCNNNNDCWTSNSNSNDNDCCSSGDNNCCLSCDDDNDCCSVLLCCFEDCSDD